MAKLGENWVKNVLESQGYKVLQLATEDTLAILEDLALIIEEKDNQYPIKVARTRVYSVAGKRKRFPFQLSQINKHTLRVIEKLRQSGRFFNLIQVYVVSNLIGRFVQIARRYNTHIFFVNKSYFPIWLKYLKYVYLGIGGIGDVNYYMGGK